MTPTFYLTGGFASFGTAGSSAGDVIKTPQVDDVRTFLLLPVVRDVPVIRHVLDWLRHRDATSVLHVGVLLPLVEYMS